MALKKQLPALPLYCDVSHIAGKRSMLRPVSQRAIDLGYDGLMIESHYNPAVALSDGQQQLMPQEVNMLLQTLNLTGQHASQAITGAKLEDLRKHTEPIRQQERREHDDNSRDLYQAQHCGRQSVRASIWVANG